MCPARVSREVSLDYYVGRENSGSGYYISRDGLGRRDAQDEAEFLFIFEKDLEIELQKLRRDLFFVHAATLEFRERAIIFPASSGSGKSTFTWGMLHNGFRYLSDELAPIDLDTMQVLAYPHALCLKSEPPGPYQLPRAVIRTSHALHVPVAQFADALGPVAVPLTEIFFLEYHPAAAKPEIRRISASAAAARLFSHALNPLAHSNSGLDAAIHIVKKVKCYELQIAVLEETCRQVKAFFSKQRWNQLTPRRSCRKQQ